MFIDKIKQIGLKRSRVIQKVKNELTLAFLMVEMGPISFYLGLKVEHDWETRTIKLSQPAYIDKILEKYQLDKVNAINNPMKKIEFLIPRTDGEISLSKKKIYQGITRLFMFSIVKTRPDIAFATLIIRRFTKNLSR